ncbi:unnamed protein product [Tuwongella immobilis]|uniref:Uncharacterized protein n=1 Tax=Tuwongella immobilis TaxID=692036 RepID=A0A6C2YQ42_9BACT|nr:unnamed protein product [Tuwongella immobilis]VTS04234.1 unnamed protein product [Tuwongella immobilis]
MIDRWNESDKVLEKILFLPEKIRLEGEIEIQFS